MSSFDSSLPLGPSIADASHTDALFQSDQQIADGLRRRAKKEKQLGNPLELPSKILGMVLAPEHEAATGGGNSESNAVYAYVANSNYTARKVNLLASVTGTRVYRRHRC